MSGLHSLLKRPYLSVNDFLALVKTLIQIHPIYCPRSYLSSWAHFSWAHFSWAHFFPAPRFARSLWSPPVSVPTKTSTSLLTLIDDFAFAPALPRPVFKGQKQRRRKGWSPRKWCQLQMLSVRSKHWLLSSISRTNETIMPIAKIPLMTPSYNVNWMEPHSQIS